MPREAASSLPPWGGRGVGLLARENPAVPQLLTGKEMPPLRSSPGRGDKGGISGQLRRCGRIPVAMPAAGDVPPSALARLARRTQGSRLDCDNRGAQAVFRALARSRGPRAGVGGLGRCEAALA